MVIFLFALLVTSAKVSAQSFHYQYAYDIVDWVFWCEETGNSFSISGNVVYQLTVQVNPKTNKVTRIHNNVLHADIYNTATGEKYQYIDTGANDNLGTWWPEWLGIFPEQPVEGITVASAGLKIVGKGGVLFRIKTVIQLHINANGDVIVDSEKGWTECNY